MARAERDAVGGRPRLSVFCRVQEEGQTVDEFLERLCAEAPVTGKHVWMCRLEVVESRGFELHHAPPPPCHYDVDIGDGPLEAAVADFQAAFEDKKRNPAWRS